MKKLILLFLAVTAHAASIPINSLPFTITAPGTYVLTHDMSFPTVAAVITLIAPISGPVTIDFKGFTITAGPFPYNSYCINMRSDISPSGQYPTVIQNGTITGFQCGISDFQVFNLTINKMVFNQNSQPIIFGDVAPSMVSNCTFNGFASLSAPGTSGIWDSEEQTTDATGGNTFSGDVFLNIPYPIEVFRAPRITTPLLLRHYQTSVPR